MNFLKTCTWKDTICFLISFVGCVLLFVIMFVSEKGDSVPKEALKDATITLKNWEIEGVPGHRSLIITDTNSVEYYVDGIFLHEAFCWEDWNDSAENGDILQVTFYEKENGDNSIFALTKENHVYMSVEDALNAQSHNNNIGRYIGYFAIMAATVFLLLILGIVFANRRKSISNNTSSSIEKLEDICDEGTENIIKVSFRCTINRIYMSTGQSVKKGNTLLEISAMQMRFPVVADIDGMVKEIYVKPGDVVEKDTPLIKLKDSL